MELKIVSPKYGEFIVYYDEEDHELISKYKWHLKPQAGHYTNYVHSTIYDKQKKKPITVVMHRLIMGYPIGKEVDHKDRNGLNNRKSNLRVVSKSKNQANKIMPVCNTTGFKGVNFHKNTNKYVARVSVNNKRVLGGYFLTAKEAAQKYNEMALKHHGEYARLNIIPNE